MFTELQLQHSQEDWEKYLTHIPYTDCLQKHWQIHPTFSLPTYHESCWDKTKSVATKWHRQMLISHVCSGQWNRTTSDLTVCRASQWMNLHETHGMLCMQIQNSSLNPLFSLSLLRCLQWLHWLHVPLRRSLDKDLGFMFSSDDMPPFFDYLQPDRIQPQIIEMTRPTKNSCWQLAASWNPGTSFKYWYLRQPAQIASLRLPLLKNALASTFACGAARGTVNLALFSAFYFFQD